MRENAYFFPKLQLSLKSEQPTQHVNIWGGGSIIIARNYCLGTILFCWETQHLKGPGATLVQGRCCRADALRLVEEQVQDTSLQIALGLVLRKTKAGSGISATRGWKYSCREGGSWGDHGYEMHLFQSCEVP